LEPAGTDNTVSWLAINDADSIGDTMMKGADLARSLDEDWPPRQTITITDLIAEACAIGILLTGVTRAGMTPATRMPVACLNACWLTLGAKAAPA